VYQKNIYGDKPFVSFKRVINELGAPYNKLELASFHSVSKGITGECGLRGGYMELVNIDKEVMAQILKLRSIVLCPNTIGQMMVELMVNPPKAGVNSAAIVERHERESKLIFDGLKTRAKLLTQKLNSIPRITCNEIEGAMYAFPRIDITESAIAAAKAKGMVADVFYCGEVLKNTGLMLVPGSGFKQRDGTYHFRITNLIYNTEEFDGALENLKIFTKKFFETYP
jgi:aspartate/methionine/tyrosine aminotransferase